jgi:tetratricopeptide (TPR) repeat protein
MLLLMTEVTALAPPVQAGSAGDAPANEVKDLASVLQQLDDLTEDRAFGVARAELDKAFKHFGEQAKLLARLAAVEFRDDLLEQAMATYRRAVKADPADPEVAADYCAFLHALGMQRTAMDFINGLSPDMSDSPRIREALGAIYRWAGWRSLAVDAYGDRRGLSRDARRNRMRCWWASGGPVPFLRRWAHDFDDQARSKWHLYSETLSAFDALDQPSGFAAARVRGEVDAYLENWALIGTKIELAQSLARHWVTRYPVVFILAWVTVFLTLNATHPGIGAVGTAFAAAAAAALGLILRFPLAAFVNAGSTFISETVRATLAMAGLIGGGVSLIIAIAAPPAWPGVIGAALLVAAGMGAVNSASLNLPWAAGNLQIGLMMRDRPRAAVLERLLDLLTQIERPDLRTELARRDYWIWLLEAAAKRTERDLARTVPCRDPQTAEWVRERACGAATALRILKRQIAAPTPSGWDRLAASLRHDASALAGGDFGLMRWAQPPSAASKRRSLLRTTLMITQRVLVATVPVVVVLALQPVLKLTGSDLVLARGGSIFWAVFYLIITIDPGLVSKVQQAHDVFNEIKSISSPKP